MTDAFGRALYDYHRDRLGARPRFRRDDGDTNEITVEAYFRERGEWSPLAREMVERLRGGVLDAGCGAGRVALDLQRRGRAVVAIDRGVLAALTARERGVERALAGDLCDPPLRSGAVDSVLALGQQLFVGESVDDLRESLAALARLTGPGGRIVADFVDPTRDLPAELREYLSDRWLDEGATARRFRVEYGDEIGPWTSVLMLSPATLREVVAETPWRVTELLREGNTNAAVLDR